MKKCFALLALMFAVSFATPVSEHGKLSVSGRKILDKNGNEYVLRGMSMFWNSFDVGKKFYKQSTVTELATNWNANVVRAAIGNGSVQDAKDFMDWTATAGIYVIIDWHYHNLDENGAKNFFKSVSQYVKDKKYNHVIYEIFNEPCSGANGTSCGSKLSWDQIKSYSEKVIDEIRANDSDGLIIVGTPIYSSYVVVAKDNPITGSRARNILYSLHFYSSDPEHILYLTYAKVVWCADKPIFISEFGTSKADGGSDYAAMDREKTDKWMSWVESWGLSWANWSIVDKRESSAALKENCCSNGTFGNSNLRESGTYIQNIMKKRNTGGTISDAGLTQQDVACSQSGGGGTVREKDGILKFGSLNAAVNFYGDISGLIDSTKMTSSSGVSTVLKNSASTFKASYFLTDVPAPGMYAINFRYGAANSTTVSWQGDNLGYSSATLPATGTIEKWENSENFLITLTDAGSTPINLTFNSNGTGNFVFLNLSVFKLSKNDSLKYNVAPIVMQQSPKQQHFFDISGRNLLLHSSGDLEVYSLQGKRLVFFADRQNGETISLQNLPSGAYIAVLRKFGQVHAKTIYLK
jgi:endoglucanase